MNTIIVPDFKGVFRRVTARNPLVTRTFTDMQMEEGMVFQTFIRTLVPSGQTLVLKAVLPAEITQYGISRTLETSAQQLCFKLYYQPTVVPPTVSPLTMNNQNGESDNISHSVYSNCGLFQTSTMNFGGHLVTALPLFGSITTSASKSQVGSTADVDGRRYKSGTYLIMITNEGGIDTEIYYRYKYAELEK